MIFVVVILAYLFASIPVGYIFSKWFNKTEIMKMGSKNPGAANVISNVGPLWGISVGIIDLLIKGYFFTLLLQAMDLPEVYFNFSLIALIIGHNWSVFLVLKGGRGVLTSIGVFCGLGLYLEVLILFLLLVVVGRLLIYKDSAFWTLIAIITLPVLMIVFERELNIFYIVVTILFFVILKRILSNSPLYVFSRFPYTFINRIIWDRDIFNKEKWLEQKL